MKKTGYARAHGPNTGLVFDREGKILENLIKYINSVPQYYVDDKQRDIVIESGGKALFNTSTEGIVFERGDRYNSIVQIIEAFLNPYFVIKSYQGNQSGADQIYRSPYSPHIGPYGGIK